MMDTSGGVTAGSHCSTCVWPWSALSACREQLHYFPRACVHVNLNGEVGAPRTAVPDRDKRKRNVINVAAQLDGKAPALVVFPKTPKGLQCNIVGLLRR